MFIYGKQCTVMTKLKNIHTCVSQSGDVQCIAPIFEKQKDYKHFESIHPQKTRYIQMLVFKWCKCSMC